MKLLGSEFARATAETEEYGQESDKLRLKIEKVTQEINLQTQKVKLSREAYDKAKQSGKLSEQQLDNLKITYNYNQAQLAKLNTELKNYEKESKKAEESAKTFGDTIRNVASTFGVDINPAIETLASKFDGISEAAGAAVLTIGTVATGLISCSVEAAKYADDLVTLSSVTGISTETLQKFEYASNLVDVSTEQLSDSLKEVTNKMKEARNGSEDAVEAFNKLHVKYQDTNGELRDSEEVFYELIDSLGKVRNETERDALAMTLFGESGRNLNPLIEAGSDRLKELGVKAEDLGLVLDDVSLDKMVSFKDSMDKFDVSAKKVKMHLGEALLPVLTDVMDVVSGIPEPILEVIIIAGGLSILFINIAKAARTMAVANTILSASNTTLGVTGATAAIGMGPLLIALVLIATAIALITVGVSQVNKSLKETKNEVQGVVDSANEVADSMNKKQSRAVNHNASGTRNYYGGRTWVGEAGPELVDLPSGSNIYSNRESMQMAGAGTNIFYVTIDAHNVKEYNDVVEMCRREKQARRRM